MALAGKPVAAGGSLEATIDLYCQGSGLAGSHTLPAWEGD